MKAGDVLHLTRAASVQFIKPIMFRLIKERTDLHTYHGWVWLDGYELNERGDAVARRELFVIRDGVRVMNPPPTPQPRTRKHQAHAEMRSQDGSMRTPRS
ncbi:hypothetical protein ACQP0I_13755 [Micromonospora carbonacea]|uniref:hypothetical protein n=1 Tax=Micromonospora carbonacea TaxID=47853 RepID=UPI003D988AC5